MDPMTPPPSDPMGSFDPSGPPKGGGAKVMIILVVAVVLALILGLGAVLLSSGGDDGDDADDDTTEEADAADDPPVDDGADDAADEDEDEGDSLDSDEPDDTDDDGDLDGDGIPDVEDTDDDGDGIPDTEDPKPDEPGDGDDDGDGDGDDGEGDDGDGEVDPPAADDLFQDPSPAIDGWLDAAGGGVKAVEVVIYPEYGIATFRDPDRPNKVYRSMWRDGSVSDDPPGDPFPGTDLDAESFRLTRPNWDALPGLVANAPERAHLPQGHVTHVVVSSDAPFSDRKLFRIYVEAPNGSDYVVATIDGQPTDR
jgi:hypothetical protein